MFRERHLIPQDVGERCVSILALEWGRAVEHFIHEDTQGPPIHSTGVPAAFDNFRSNVFFGSNEGVSSEVGNAGFSVDGRK